MAVTIDLSRDAPIAPPPYPPTGAGEGRAGARGYWAGVGRRLLRDPVALAAAFVIIGIVFAAILAPWLGLADPYRGSMLRRLRPIADAVYRLGSDELGRDMLSRLVYGGRLSLLMGVLPVVFAFFAGSAIGGIAETQEMLDFCATHGIVSDIELIPIQKINEAWERLLKQDVRYRFVIDMASLKS